MNCDLTRFLALYQVDGSALREATGRDWNAEIKAIRANQTGCFILLQLNLEDDLPKGEEIHALQLLLASSLNAEWVKLCLRYSENPQDERKLGMARSVLNWLKFELMESRKLLAASLHEEQLLPLFTRTDSFLSSNSASSETASPETEKGRERFQLILPSFVNGQLNEQSAAEIRQFFTARGGLDMDLEIREEEAELSSGSHAADDYAEQLRALQDQFGKTQGSEEEEAEEGCKGKKNQGKGKDQTTKNPALIYKKKKLDNLLWGKMYEVKQDSAIAELGSDSGTVQITGRVSHFEQRAIKSGLSVLCHFTLEDASGAIACVLFCKPDEIESLAAFLSAGPHIKAEAEIHQDSRYSQDIQAKISGYMEAQAPSERLDHALVKRVELHCHTKMSAKDAVSDAASIIKQADRFGHPAVAITDHGVVQSFPEACETVDKLRKKGSSIKLIYGMEGYLVDDGPVCVYGLDELNLSDSYVALDVETTGLDCCTDRLIEVAAVRFSKQEDGSFRESEHFQQLINPAVSLSEKSRELTGLSDLDLLPMPPALEVLPALHQFIGRDPVVAHNALFDLGFLRAEAFRSPPDRARLKFNPVLIDTLELARTFLPDLSRYSLDSVAADLNIALDRHHRALDDARCCGMIFNILHERLGRISLEEINKRAGKVDSSVFMGRKYPQYHLILLARSSLGLYNLYRLVSESHIRYIGRRPRIPRSLLTYLRHGLLLGSACEAGEVFRQARQAYVTAGRDRIKALDILKRPENKKIGRYYDYLEVQPLCNNRFLINKENTGILSDEDLRQLNHLVLDWAEALKKMAIATCDVHFLNKEDAIYRQILLLAQGYTDHKEQAQLYFRTTDEMLEEFSYLGEKKAGEIVVDNPQRIADRIEADMRPFPQGSFPPKIAEAASLVEAITWETAASRYDAGDGLPEIVAQRLKRELDSIISHGFAIMYYISHKLVKKSNEDGYIVGSRGSVGSSLVATLCGITEVNPLPPHYYCPACRYSEFDTSGNYGSGFDLPARACPACGQPLARDGQDIPFETFLGFNGDKQPDIDQNFSGEYQARAHAFIENMFGQDHTFRAGTIGSYAEKNAQGMVLNYTEALGLTATRAEMNRLGKGLLGVKKTTGQHPGGIVVIPKDREIYDFSPVQYPADNKDSQMRTTHFDFNAMHDTILKLDVLGHDDPTMLRMLSDITGVNVTDIPIPDPDVMALFTDSAALRYVLPTDQTSSTLGIPEMGTFMARKMIEETKPTQFYDLVQLMGLSHGTDVWTGNAQDLIKNAICDINSVIGCRDSIMTTLIYKGLPAKAAFDIMEQVRKGKGLSVEQEALMAEHQVESWYVESCKKIKYMFPKAHAVAYAISSLRVAWFKVHHPEAYYAAYFTVRADEFDSRLMCRGLEQTILHKNTYYGMFNDRATTAKDKNIFYILELVQEMEERGIQFLPISLTESDATRFQVVEKGKIRPPFNVIPGFSSAMAENLLQARSEGEFHTKDEVARRAQLGAAAIAALEEEGVLRELPDSAQIDIFSLLGGS